MASDFLTVGTTSGEILGHLVDGAPCLVEYLGIPYAQPPVSSLRFQPAKQLQASKRTVFVADSFSPKCIQSPSKDLSAFPGLTPQALQVLDEFTADDGLPQSEDCLTLNIWAQTTQASLKNTKPVLVHMYGGRKCVVYDNGPAMTWQLGFLLRSA